MGDRDLVGEMNEDDRRRIGRILASAAEAVGGNVVWGSQSWLEVWITEHRIAAERRATARLTTATYVLGAMTFALVVATVALAIATVAH